MELTGRLIRRIAQGTGLRGRAGSRERGAESKESTGLRAQGTGQSA